MDDDRDLAGFFEDLEQQAEGLHLAERDAELADRARAEYAQVRFESRVHASRDLPVSLSLAGGSVVQGGVLRAGTDWVLLAVGGVQTDQEWLVRLGAVLVAEGLSSRATADAARPVTARLGLGSALRGLAEGGRPLVVHHTDGARTTGVVARVGADFVETVVPAEPGSPARGSTPDGPRSRVLRFAGIAAVSTR